MKDDLQQIAINLISQYGNEAQTIAMLRAAEHAASSVSYTHLTLPTILLV